VKHGTFHSPPRQHSLGFSPHASALFAVSFRKNGARCGCAPGTGLRCGTADSTASRRRSLTGLALFFSGVRRSSLLFAALAETPHDTFTISRVIA